ncbi:MAG: ATP-binding cassette domain-containing protein, partial [Candidatus Saccharibacteria bacterium]
MEAETIVDIDNLYLNFYTKSGVVYALDGVNLKIHRGEAIGLVGESGCGKSVTANSIMRLIPNPPGKIENGSILFNMPPGVRMKRERLAEMLKTKGEDHPEVMQLREELNTLLSDYDIIRKPEEELRTIRGKAISMIFQEPMSSLNPVFTAGFQISEVLLLHERAQLAEEVLQRLEHQEAALNDYVHVKMKKDPEGDLRCTKCNAKVDKYFQYCPQCNGSFKVRLVPSMTRSKLRWYRRFYTRMKEN